MSNNSNTPRLRFPEFKEEWKEKKFKDITISSGKRNSQNLPYERYSISNENGFYPQNEQFEGGAGYLKNIDCSKHIIVSPQTFAYNPARINIGSIGYQNLDHDVIVSPLYEIFKTNDSCDDDFLWQWFHTEVFNRLVINGQEGGVRLCFSYNKLQQCSIKIPSLPEQQKIASCLTEMDNLISAQGQRVEALKEKKKGLMQQLFPQNGESTPRLRFPGFEGEWDTPTIAEVFEIRNGYTPSKRVAEYWEGGTIPWFRMEDIRENGGILVDSIQHITRDAVKGSGLFKKNSIIVATTATIGVHAMLIADSLANQQFSNFSIRESLINKYSPKFVYYAFFGIDEWCKKNTNAGGLLSVNMPALLKQVFFTPTFTEQQTIASFLSELDNLIAAESDKLENLKNYKKGLMQQLFPQPVK